MKPIIKPVINLAARSKQSGHGLRIKTSGNVGLFASKDKSRAQFRQTELNKQIKLRQRLERARNAGVDAKAKEAIGVKTKQVENSIGILQRDYE